jgi:demethylmenaquinone methyltransferase/2-methoxy-6-polyprenyl-1,4-benzoquinol methylase
VSNKFYQAGEQRGARVADLFGTIAARYDLINDLQSLGLHRRWKRLVVEMAGVKQGEKALDLCCGTGDIAFGLNRAGAEVIGLDFSPAMLAVARERGHRDKSTVQFIEGDALKTPFDDSVFDIVTIGYGLRNLSSCERGLQEMIRVTRHGGRILALEFGKPDLWFWRQIYFGYLRAAVPLLGKILCHDSDTHAYIFESLRHYPGQREVAEKLKAMNCHEIVTRNLLGGAMSIHFARKCGSQKKSLKVPESP